MTVVMTKVWVAFAVAAALGVSGCGVHTVSMVRRANARDNVLGYVTTSAASARGEQVEVSVYGLAVGAAGSYVVWLVPRAAATAQKLGTLGLSGAGDDQTLSGFLRATMPEGVREGDVVVTLEEDTSVNSPHSERLLWASVRP